MEPNERSRSATTVETLAIAPAVPGGILAALAVTVADPAPRLPLLLSVVALVVAPAGLLVATLGDRYRQRIPPG